jgi:hypothetical protein
MVELNVTTRRIYRLFPNNSDTTLHLVTLLSFVPRGDIGSLQAGHVSYRKLNHSARNGKYEEIVFGKVEKGASQYATLLGLAEHCMRVSITLKLA